MDEYIFNKALQQFDLVIDKNNEYSYFLDKITKENYCFSEMLVYLNLALQLGNSKTHESLLSFIETEKERLIDDLFTFLDKVKLVLGPRDWLLINSNTGDTFEEDEIFKLFSKSFDSGFLNEIIETKLLDLKINYSWEA